MPSVPAAMPPPPGSNADPPAAMPPSPSPLSTAHRTHRAPQRPQMSWHSTPAGCRAACALAMWRRRVPRRDHSTAPTGSCQRTGSYCRHGGRRELRGRTRTGLVHMHRRGGRGGRLAVARMCRARQPGRVDCTSRAAGERGGAMCRWRGIGGKGAVQHGADWRAVSVHELDCVRCARSGGVHRGSGGLLRWQLPQGDPSSTHT